MSQDYVEQPCSCGAPGARWHGAENELRVYACDTCWKRDSRRGYAEEGSRCKHTSMVTKEKRRLIVRWSKREKTLVVDGRAPGPDRAWIIFMMDRVRAELEQRGYDPTTFRLRIEHKNQAGLDTPVERA